MAGDPFAYMTDEAVFARARDALKREAQLPPGSAERAIAGAEFNAAMGELDARMVRHIRARIREQYGG